MATTTRVEMTDDLDGTSLDVSTVTFAFEGVSYEIDLSEANHAKLTKALRPYVNSARPVGGRRGRRPSKASKPDPVTPDSKAVRAWAEANGVTVSSRGRIPSEVLAAYRDAGN